jgi:hypothetical protein
MKNLNIGTLTHDAPNRDKFLKLTIVLKLQQVLFTHQTEVTNL